VKRRLLREERIAKCSMLVARRYRGAEAHGG
jgi:hypothetical protein